MVIRGLGTCVSDLSRVAAWQCGGRESNPRQTKETFDSFEEKMLELRVRPNHNQTNEALK